MDTPALDRLNEYASLGLGLTRSDVQLLPHHPRWKRAFSDEAHVIYNALRLEQLRLFHAGSTSIPGICAKPILDIVGSVPSLEELDKNKGALEALGYEYKGEYGIPGRRYSVLYDAAKTRGFVHLHLFQHDHPEVESHLVFRDFLRSQPSVAARYEEKKKQLLAAGTARKDYTEAKADLIQELIRAAPKKNDPSVLALMASAPGGGNTLSFLKESYAGARLEIADLATLSVSPYRYDSAYANDDAFLDLVRKMIASDLIVFATPIYWYAMSGPLKDFFDRYSQILRGPHKELGEALYGKKFKLLVTGADERLPFGFEAPFSLSAIYLGMDYLGSSYRKY